MKKLILLIFATALLTSCMEQVPKSCADVQEDDVVGWVKDFHGKKSPEYLWIGTTVYKGETIFYTTDYQEGWFFCGTGLEAYDMYVFFDCKGRQIKEDIRWSDLGDMEVYYDDYPQWNEEEEEEKDNS